MRRKDGFTLVELLVLIGVREFDMVSGVRYHDYQKDCQSCRRRVK